MPENSARRSAPTGPTTCKPPLRDRLVDIAQTGHANLSPEYYKDPEVILSVSNIAKTVPEADLRALFARFGPIQSFFLPMRLEGPAQIRFEKRGDAIRADKEIGGTFYHNMVLHTQLSEALFYGDGDDDVHPELVLSVYDLAGTAQAADKMGSRTTAFAYISFAERVDVAEAHRQLDGTVLDGTAIRTELAEVDARIPVEHGECGFQMQEVEPPLRCTLKLQELAPDATHATVLVATSWPLAGECKKELEEAKKELLGSTLLGDRVFIAYEACEKPEGVTYPE
ncbi:hypothetical protein PG994_003552 [Apiospora phragmitis]|uniref:RRM domain-containing protein n=1 Tax=Apiospora phragmitis TaxID=2905665 RepID=A0ABR1W1I5_9PEZI